MRHDFGQAPGVRGHDWRTGSHRFECGQAEGFRLARQEKQIGTGQKLLHRAVLAEEDHTVLHTQSPSRLDDSRSLRAVADHDQAGGHTFSYARENVHHVPHALHGPEVRHVHDDLLPRLGE